MDKNWRSRNVVERSETAAQVAPAMISCQRDLRLLFCKSGCFAAWASPLEYALTQKGGRGGCRERHGHQELRGVMKCRSLALPTP